MNDNTCLYNFPVKWCGIDIGIVHGIIYSAAIFLIFWRVSKIETTWSLLKCGYVQLSSILFGIYQYKPSTYWGILGIPPLIGPSVSCRCRVFLRANLYIYELQGSGVSRPLGFGVKARKSQKFIGSMAGLWFHWRFAFCCFLIWTRAIVQVGWCSETSKSKIPCKTAWEIFTNQQNPK